MGVINAEEVQSSETENSGVRKYDMSTSESNVIQQLEYVSWKYPHSISVNNNMNYKKSTHTLGKYTKVHKYNNYIVFFIFC